MSVTEEIKNRLDIVDVVSDYVPLRKSGKNFVGFCPFHPNSKTPAFSVSPERQSWRCFGACAEGGDVFSFVMKKEGWDFREALVELARRAGVALEPPTPTDQARQATADKQADLLSAAADYFHQLLLHAPQAAFARSYLEKRGLSPETISAFRLGFALDAWDACRSHFNAQGYEDEELLEAGLLTANPDKGTRYDRFRNRLVIPIRNINGQVAGFGARTLAPDGVPKYLNSPQTALFDKSQLLFGLDAARRHIREARQAVIVEGYMDVMQAWQAGFRNVVAQMGTALTPQQLQQLKRYGKRIILALDADAAGEQATLRSLEVAGEALDHEYDVRFDARGLVRHEARLKADIRVVTMPDGMDPDDVIQSDPGAWPRLLERAQPIVDYIIEVVTRDLDLTDAKAKAAVAQRILPVIGWVGDPVEREHYRQRLARVLQIDERTLRQVPLPRKRTQRSGSHKKQSAVATGKGVERDSRPTAAIVSMIGSGRSREAILLSYCLRYPRLMSQINLKLRRGKQPGLQEADFDLAEDKALLRHMYQWIKGPTVAAVDELCDSLDDVLASRVQSLLTMSPAPETELDRLPDKLVLSVLDWRLENTLQLLKELRQLAFEAQNRNDDDFLEMYQQPLRALPLEVLNINKAKGAMSALSQRRAEESSRRHKNGP